jgi:hypothetical protein
VLGQILIVSFSLYFEDQCPTVLETDEIVRFVVVLNPFIFIGDQKEGAVV